MWHLLVSVCLAIFSSSLTSASEPHYVITAPANLGQGTQEKVCMTLLDLKGTVDFKIELKKDDQVHTVAEEKVNTHNHFECYAFQVPIITDDRSVWRLHVSIHGEDINVEESKKVVIVRRDDMCIIQTDKSTYKPGDIVKFRMINVNHNFQVTSTKYPLVEIKDTKQNRIAQWLDVSTEQGFADFSFHLANELVHGKYTINIPDGCDKSFKVDKYMLRRFELSINMKSDILPTDKSFHLDTCGRYTYGKPVKGKIDLSVCAKVRLQNVKELKKSCIDIKKEKTDKKGCVSRDFELGYFNFTTTRPHSLEIKSELIEDDTGHSEKASEEVYFSSATKTAEFVECERIYHKGFPYHCTVKVQAENRKPMANEVVTIDVVNIGAYYEVTVANMVTDSNGIAQFMFNTSKWRSEVSLKVRLLSDSYVDVHEKYVRYKPPIYYDYLWLSRFYSKSESSLYIQKHSQELSCNSEQSVTVEYVIHKKNLDSDIDHLHIFYILVTKNGIFSYKEHKVDIKDQANSPNLNGSFPLHFHVVEDFFPKLSVLVFSVLPNGETIAWATDYNVSPCVRNKVKLSFSEEQVRPGENVNLEVTADAGSVCSVRSVDKGYLLEDPRYFFDELVTGIIRYTVYRNPYRYLTVDPDIHKCPENTTAEIDRGSFDVYRLFQQINLKIFTNTQIQVPVKCVQDAITARSYSRKKRNTEQKDTDKEFLKRFTRSHLPDTWLYELVSVGSEGHVILNLTTPHSVTKWATDVFCLGKTGFAQVKNVELTTFQPYFIDLIVPYSVVQGEKFTIEAMVFSYTKKCMLIAVLLANSEDLRTVNDKEQIRCVCEGSHTFYWDISALKPRALKIHVDSGSLKAEGNCTQDILVIEKNMRKDSVEKTVLVKPKGREEEKTKTFLLLPSDNREAIVINLNTPERLVPGSERAHLIILDDLMANVVVNVDNLVRMPEGGGEQNIAKFSQYVYALEYLENIQELTPEKKAEIIELLTKGYQKQLTYRTENGDYALFSGGSENIWLTAFVVKSFSGGQKFIYINENHIQQAVNWMQRKQLPNGCFRIVGNYFSYYIEASNEIALTAYVTIALLEHHVAYSRSIVEDALSCLRKSVDNVTSVHTQALLAYAFTLSGDIELRAQILKKLDERAVKKGRMKHWKTGSLKEGEIETASYVILALLSDKITTTKDLEDSVDIIHWMVAQKNPWSGFSSSQYTTLTFQALAKYSKAINHKEGDTTVTINSKSGFQKTIHVDKSNSLLLQRVDLPEIPGEYTVSATGDGFVYLQSHLHYNVLPEEIENGYFSFNVSTEPSACTSLSQRRFNVHIFVRYTGKRESTNMAMIEMEFVSGYVPDKDSREKLKMNPLVEKARMSAKTISIYLRKLTHETVSLVFTLEREARVENLHPANAVVLDYYDPDERSVTEYNAPCGAGIKVIDDD